MRINSVSTTVWIAALLCMVPAVLWASPGTVKPNTPISAPSQSATSQAPFLLERAQDEALSIRNGADRLEALLRNPLLATWSTDGEYLERVRDHVNELNKLVFQLRTGEASDSALQRKVIEHIALPAANLAASTQDAVETLNHNKSRIFATDLDALTDHIYRQAKGIDQTLTDFKEYSTARLDVQKLRHALALQGNS